MLTHLKTPFARAILFSLCAHGLIALYVHGLTNFFTPIREASTAQASDVFLINTVSLQQTAQQLNSAKARANAAADANPSPSEATPSNPPPTAATNNAQTPPTREIEPQPLIDSEALPHEELARKKEALPPASLLPKDKPMQFSLPTQVKLSYEGSWGATPVKGQLTFSLKGDDYEASLQVLASVLFKTFELKQTVRGLLNAQGLEALRAEDKAINGRVVAITAEPAAQRVVISNKEGFLPYTPGGKDLISVIFQLGILVQAQNEWQTKGTAQDFTVYRPSGIKRWRYQSQGTEKIQTQAGSVETIYIKRIPQESSQDFEYIHHFWLDPARHGLPLRIQLEDPKSGRTIELALKQWEES